MKKKVNTSVRVTEANTLAEILVSLFKKAGDVAKDPYLAELFAQLGKLSARMTTAVNRGRVSSTLDGADVARDGAARNLGTMLAGYAAFPFPEKRAAAEQLLALYGTYGRKIQSANYAEESSLIASLLEDLVAPAYAASIAALDGVAEAVAALRDAEEAFKAANEAYIKAVAADAGAESASSLKKPILSCINEKILPYLEVMSAANAGTYGAFAAEVLVEVGRINDTVSSHSKKSAKAADAAAAE